MALVASDVLSVVSYQLSDTAGNRWGDTKLLEYLNAAQMELVTLRPNASAEIKTVQLVAGSQQDVPTGAYQFLGAVRNQGSNGSTPGRAIRNVDMGAKEAFDPDWMNTLDGDIIRECCYDPATPELYWVFPAVPSGSTVYIDIRQSTRPVDLSAPADTLTVRDNYKQPLVDYCVSMAFAENTNAASVQKAQLHYQKFLRSLGIRTKTEPGLPPAAKGDAE